MEDGVRPSVQKGCLKRDLEGEKSPTRPNQLSHGRRYKAFLVQKGCLKRDLEVEKNPTRPKQLSHGRQYRALLTIRCLERPRRREVKPCKHCHLLVLLQSHLPLSYTHRDAFGRDLARKCSGVNFIFQKNYFCMWSAKTSPFAHQKTMSGTQATLRVLRM